MTGQRHLLVVAGLPATEWTPLSAPIKSICQPVYWADKGHIIVNHTSIGLKDDEPLQLTHAVRAVASAPGGSVVSTGLSLFSLCDAAVLLRGSDNLPPSQTASCAPCLGSASVQVRVISSLQESASIASAGPAKSTAGTSGLKHPVKAVRIDEAEAVSREGKQRCSGSAASAARELRCRPIGSP
jgi:hypothetical protein